MDIDAYAGCIAYAELLNTQGDNAIAASTAPLNESITQTIRDWNAKLVRDYDGIGDQFVLVDVSEPDYFDRFVVLDQVVEVIDHHMERLSYWHEKIGDSADIVFVGAACTLVAERWQKADKMSSISKTSARLLIAGILDNTLNFRAKVTTERDHAMYDLLWQYADLPDDWAAEYFRECQATIMSGLEAAIAADMKLDYSLAVIGHQIGAGQLVLWDAGKLVYDNQLQLREILNMRSDEWFLNLVSVQDGCSYFITSDTNIETSLAKLLGLAFEGGIAKADRLWLRKEIMKQDIDRR